MADVRILKAGSKGILFAFENAKDVQEYIDKKDFFNKDANFIGQGIDSFDSAQEKMNSAWLGGMEVLTAFIEKLQNAKLPKLQSCKRVTKFTSDSTDEIDLERMMEGRADFYKKTYREKIGGPPSVTIFIDTTTPFSIQSDDVLWRGAAAIAFAKMIEDKGYQTEIWVVNGSTLFEGEDTRVMTSCCLKRCSDVIDISTLVNTVSGWCYRSITFTLLAAICRKTSKRMKSSLGSCVTPTQDDLDLMSQDGNRCYSSGAFAFNAALSILETEMEKLAEKVTEIEA